MYGSTANNVLYVSGFSQGTGTSNGTTYTASGSLDFALFPAISAPLTATYGSGTINGTLTEAGRAVTFSGTAAAVAPYVYATPAKLSDVTGPWALALLDGETANVTITTTGTFNGQSSGGCQFSGSVAPDTAGKNVFTVSGTYGPAPCALPHQTSTGIAIYSLTSTGLHQLVVAVVDSSRTVGMAGVGQR